LTCTMEKHHGHAAWTSTKDTEHGCREWRCSLKTWACSLDMDIQRRHGHVTRTCNMDIDKHYGHGLATLTLTFSINMDMQQGHGYGAGKLTCHMDR
jgi:hypothetical protein